MNTEMKIEMLDYGFGVIPNNFWILCDGIDTSFKGLKIKFSGCELLESVEEYTSFSTEELEEAYNEHFRGLYKYTQKELTQFQAQFEETDGDCEEWIDWTEDAIGFYYARLLLQKIAIPIVRIN